MSAYWQRLLIGFDIFANVLLGGQLDETISSRVQRMSTAHHGWARVWRWPLLLLAKLVLGALDWIQPGHGVIAEIDDAARAQALVRLERAVIPRTSATS